MASLTHILNLLHILVGITCTAALMQLEPSNFDTITNGYKFTLIAYGAEWCPFSQQLKPILQDASEKIVHLTSSGIATIGTVDCVKFDVICSRDNIRKYPTIKYALYGEMQPQEYRGTRNSDSIVKFINESLEYRVTTIFAENKKLVEALKLVNVSQTTIVGVFPTLDASQPHQQHFNKAAMLYKSKCTLIVLYGVNETEDRMVHFEEVSSRPNHITLLKNADYPAVSNWVSPLCLQYVTELTFQNAESITDQGHPMFILFYLPDVHETHRKAFITFVKRHMLDQIDKLVFLYADGKRFSHPLTHIRKTENDLPLLVIDSLTHMYVYPGSVLEAFALSNPAPLRQFVTDLHSGRLHRMFHNWEEPSLVQSAGGVEVDKVETSPPESVMKSLLPSRKRYTLLHDEF